MSDRTRITVMLAVLAVWGTVVVAYLAQKQLPDAAVLGVAPAVILALAPSRFSRRDDPEPTRPAVDGQPEGETS